MRHLRFVLALMFGDYEGWRGFRLRELLLSELGAVTVTYEYPVAGVTAPTQAQEALLSAVLANVIATADADTTATITHNMQLTAAQLAAGQPWVTLEPLLAAAQISLWFVSSKTANTVVLTKATTAGSGNAGAQVRAIVQRPNTLVM